MNWQRLLQYTVGLALIVSFLAACSTPQPEATPTPMSTPTPASGQIKGVLLVSGGQPIQEVTLGLWITEGTGGWSEMEDARIETKPDSSGAFLFENVPPGMYVLAANFGTSSLPTFMEGDDGLIAIELAAGQTADLGTIPVTEQ